MNDKQFDSPIFLSVPRVFGSRRLGPAMFRAGSDVVENCMIYIACARIDISIDFGLLVFILM